MPLKSMSMSDAWTSLEKPVDLSQAWRRRATKEAIALPRESVVSSPQHIMNFAASLPSAIAWFRMARSSSKTIGSICATEFHTEWVYRPKRHAVFTDHSARLAEEKILLPKVSSLLNSLSGGVDRNGPGLILDVCLEWDVR